MSEPIQNTTKEFSPTSITMVGFTNILQGSHRWLRKWKNLHWSFKINISELFESTHAGMYVSPSHGLSQRTIVVTLKDILNRSAINYTYNQMKGEFLIHNWEGRIWLGSGDKPDSLKGSNLAWAGIDEPFIQKKEVFDQMIARVRHPEANHLEIFLTGTPEQLNWGYELSNRTDLDIGIVYGSTLDNLHLPEEL